MPISGHSDGTASPASARLSTSMIWLSVTTTSSCGRTPQRENSTFDRAGFSGGLPSRCRNRWSRSTGIPTGYDWCHHFKL